MKRSVLLAAKNSAMCTSNEHFSSCVNTLMFNYFNTVSCSSVVFQPAVCHMENRQRQAVEGLYRYIFCHESALRTQGVHPYQVSKYGDSLLCASELQTSVTEKKHSETAQNVISGGKRVN